MFLITIVSYGSGKADPIMHIVGIIAEYNPFHLGHAYQIQEARRKWGEETPIVIIMSGNFVQRGEPAILSKWSRASACLAAGADLVFELPFTFACASAERFASGAIASLQATGVVTDLYFGSECDDLSRLEIIADVLEQEPEPYTEVLRENLKSGISYARSRQNALIACLRALGKEMLADQVEELLSQPNVILAIEYLLALKKQQSPIQPSLLRRKGAGYHEIGTHQDFPSASAIRNIVTNTLIAGSLDIAELAKRLSGHMPRESLSIMLAEYQSGVRPVFMSDFTHDLIASILRSSKSDLENYAYMGDQVAARLKNVVSDLRQDTNTPLDETLRGNLRTKRFAGTRINRAACALLVGETAEDLTKLTYPLYLRVLGFSDKGRYILRLMRKSSSLPIIDKSSDLLEHGHDEALSRMAALDRFSSDLWCLKAGLPYGDDFSRTVIFEKRKKK